MKAPQAFHGTSGDVTVALSAASRDTLVGASPYECASAGLPDGEVVSAVPLPPPLASVAMTPAGWLEHLFAAL